MCSINNCCVCIYFLFVCGHFSMNNTSKHNKCQGIVDNLQTKDYNTEQIERREPSSNEVIVLREERLRKIVERLVQKRSVLCNELADEFSLNVATIRLDLSELELRGLARRVYGGAILPEEQQIKEGLAVSEPQLSERFASLQPEKEAIGRAAANLIADGDTIMIDGGTTTFQVCRNLSSKRNLTIISNVLNNLWQELASRSDLQIFSTGGYLRAESLSYVGDVAESMLHGFRASKAIIGIDGISLEHGFTTLNFMEAAVKKRMIEMSEELIIVADHTKFSKIGLIPVAPIERANRIVTDNGVPSELVARLEKRGVQLLITDTAAMAKQK